MKRESVDVCEFLKYNGRRVRSGELFNGIKNQREFVSLSFGVSLELEVKNDG